VLVLVLVLVLEFFARSWKHLSCLYSQYSYYCRGECIHFKLLYIIGRAILWRDFDVYNTRAAFCSRTEENAIGKGKELGKYKNPIEANSYIVNLNRNRFLRHPFHKFEISCKFKGSCRTGATH
jgi:hypothetical protein